MGGLIGWGQQEQNSALGGLGAASALETNRENASNQLKAQHTQGIAGMTASGAMAGAAIGATYGASGGPIGVLVGASIGFITGELM